MQADVYYREVLILAKPSQVMQKRMRFWESLPKPPLGRINFFFIYDIREFVGFVLPKRMIHKVLDRAVTLLL